MLLSVFTETALQYVKETLKLPIVLVIDGRVQGLSMRTKYCLPLHDNSNWEVKVTCPPVVSLASYLLDVLRIISFRVKAGNDSDECFIQIILLDIIS